VSLFLRLFQRNRGRVGSSRVEGIDQVIVGVTRAHMCISSSNYSQYKLISDPRRPASLLIRRTREIAISRKSYNLVPLNCAKKNRTAPVPSHKSCALSSVIDVPDNPLVRLPTDVVGRNTLNAVIKLSGLQGRAPITGNVFSWEECQCLKYAKKLRWVCTFNHWAILRVRSSSRAMTTPI
jgi:hypothetical protein